MSDVITKDKKEEFIEYLKEKGNKGYRQSALMPALHKAQELFGYISKEAVEEISSRLHIPSAHIWGAITFYHYFSLKPRGKYIISVCLGTACYVKGAERLAERINEELGIEVGQTTKDKVFTLATAFCMGCCGLAPAMTINGKVYGEVTAEKVSQILKELRSKKGRRKSQPSEKQKVKPDFCQYSDEIS